MKKHFCLGLLTLILALVFSFSFVACDNGSTDDGGDVPPVEEPGVQGPDGVYGGGTGGANAAKSPEKIAEDNVKLLGSFAAVSSANPREVIISGPVSIPAGGMEFPSTLSVRIDPVVAGGDVPITIPNNSKLTIGGDLNLNGNKLQIISTTAILPKTPGELVLDSVAAIKGGGIIDVPAGSVITFKTTQLMIEENFRLNLKGTMNIEEGAAVFAASGYNSGFGFASTTFDTNIAVKKGGTLYLPISGAYTPYASLAAIGAVTGTVNVQKGGQLNLISGNFSGTISNVAVYKYIGDDKSDFSIKDGSMDVVISASGQIDRNFVLKGKATAMGGDYTPFTKKTVGTTVTYVAGTVTPTSLVYIPNQFIISNNGTADSELTVGAGSKNVFLGVLSGTNLSGTFSGSTGSKKLWVMSGSYVVDVGAQVVSSSVTSNLITVIGPTGAAANYYYSGDPVPGTASANLVTQFPFYSGLYSGIGGIAGTTVSGVYQP